MRVELLPGAVITKAGSSIVNKTGSWRHMRPVREEALSPCTLGCPIGNRIPEFMDLVSKNRLEEAARVLYETNPLPSICGRVCYHPCENECNRKEFDEAVSIRSVERFLGDSFEPEINSPPDSAPRIAIVGSGPAGLSCAYHLVRLGYRPVVFEKKKVIGGMLAIGIPEYRLPKSVLNREIARLRKIGVEFVTGTEISSLDQLKEFKAVFLAFGATKNIKLGIPGEDAEGVYAGIDFLEKVNSGQKPQLGTKCLVIGGGNTAIDCARSAKRLGASVTILYRRTEKEMPAFPEEVKAAREEGIEIEFLVAPKEILVENGRVSGLKCVRMQLGPPDESGRPRPVPVEGSDFIIESDSIIAAVGQQTELLQFGQLLETKKGKIVCDEWGRTNVKGVFAGGDAVLGTPERVADAIAAGRKAALAIDAYLREKELPTARPGVKVEFRDLNVAYFTHAPRLKPPTLPPHLRRDFEEIEGQVGIADVVKEAARCFSCGHCNRCDNCWLFCPEMAVSRTDGDYTIDYDYCKGCGICAEECPRKVIQMKAE